MTMTEWLIDVQNALSEGFVDGKINFNSVGVIGSRIKTYLKFLVGIPDPVPDLRLFLSKIQILKWRCPKKDPEKAKQIYQKFNKINPFKLKMCKLSPTLTDAAHWLDIWMKFLSSSIFHLHLIYFCLFLLFLSSKGWVGVFIMQIYCTIFFSLSSSLASCRNLHDNPKKDIINMYSKTSFSIHHKIEEKNCIYDIFYEF